MLNKNSHTSKHHESISETSTPIIESSIKSHHHRLVTIGKIIIPVVIVAGVALVTVFAGKSLMVSYSLWTVNYIPRTTTTSDRSSIELGVKFESRNSGYITAIRFYKDTQNTGVHVGSLWSASGTLLARAVFSHETASGWQTAKLIQPVGIAANVVYVVSYHAPNGHYSLSNNYFSLHSYQNGPLMAITGTKQHPNGVYIDSHTPQFPTDSLNGANSWVDLVFSTKRFDAPAAPAPPSVITATANGPTVIISWTAGISANPISGYRVLRNGSVYTTVSSESFSYTDRHVLAGQLYNYQVETIDNTGRLSTASDTASVTYNAVPVPTVSLAASSTTITAGESVTLTWSSTNATSCQAASPLDWTKSNAVFGGQIVMPVVTTTYVMVCHGDGGVTTSAPLTVKIPPTVNLSASPTTIIAGSSTVLSWSSTNAASCRAVSPAGWTVLETTSGEQSVSPKTGTTYIIACQGNGGTTDSAPVTVQVKPLSSSTILPTGNVPGPWKLVFDSEFNGSTLDQTQWSTGVDGASGITDGYDYTIEQECYDPAQVSLSAGVLALTAIAKTESCPPISGTLPYASGTITTYGHFSYTYGYAEAEIWLPGVTEHSRLAGLLGTRPVIRCT